MVTCTSFYNVITGMDFMIFKKSLILFILLFLPLRLSAFSFLADYKAQKAYQEKDYKKTKTILETEQVDDPDNPILSFNIGTANYKLADYKQAQLNFEHAAKNSKENKLKEVSYFNWANSFYKNCLKELGPNWEKEKIDDKKLEFAINEVQQAIEKYKNALVLNPENEMAKFNKKKAEELLEKLQQKKQQQDQQKQDQKEDKDKQEQKDQQQQDQQQKQNQDQSSQNKDEGKQDKQEQQKGEDHPEQSEKEKQDGQDDQLKQEQEKQEQQKEGDHDKSSSDKKEKQEQQQSEQNLEQEQQKNQEMQEQMGQGVEEKEEKQADIKEKGMQVILDKLQNEESNLQKKIIMQKSKGDTKQLNKNQKPW